MREISAPSGNACQVRPTGRLPAVRATLAARMGVVAYGSSRRLRAMTGCLRLNARAEETGDPRKGVSLWRAGGRRRRSAGLTVEALQRPQVVERLCVDALTAVYEHAVAHPHDGVGAARRGRWAAAGQLSPLRRAYVQHMHRVQPLFTPPPPPHAPQRARRAAERTVFVSLWKPSPRASGLSFQRDV